MVNCNIARIAITKIWYLVNADLVGDDIYVYLLMIFRDSFLLLFYFKFDKYK